MIRNLKMIQMLNVEIVRIILRVANQSSSSGFNVLCVRFYKIINNHDRGGGDFLDTGSYYCVAECGDKMMILRVANPQCVSGSLPGLKKLCVQDDRSFL